MPFKRRVTRRPASRRPSRKRTYKRKQTIHKTTASLGKGFPKQLQITHRYVDQFSLTSNVGTVGSYFLSCNGMFDPNVSGTGHQPLYFDQMTALYDQYCVIGSSIKVTMFPSTGSTSGVACVLYVNDDNASPANFQTLAEQTTATIKYMAFNNSDPLVMTKKWSAKKYFGGAVLANDELQGNATGNPVEQSFFNIAIQSANQTDTLSVVVMVELSYIAIWKELRDINGS